jgi:hypothetical protein
VRRSQSITPGMFSMYPEPDILSKHTLSPLTPSGGRVGALLQDDATMQHLAVVHGFRTAKPVNDRPEFLRRYR